MMLLGGLQGLSASYGKGSQNSTAKDTASKESTVSAGRTVSIESGKDTDIIGSQVKAEQVTANVAGNLHIESEQDSKEYHEEGKQIGASLGYNVASHQFSGFGSAGKSKTDSHYASVTEQAGIQAGKDGFDLTVGKETSLKGAVISSTAEKEKNHLTTGTLSWEDVENKANYKESGAGLTINTSKDAKYNEKGIIPAIPTGSKDTGSSTTNSAIAEGTIVITDKAHQKQDVSRLNRDSKNSLNQLGEIFDKAKSNERQELAGLFGEMAFNQLHDAKLTPNQRSAWHALIGGIMGQLSNKDFLGGATAAGINEMLIKQIEKASHGDPALMQWMSAAVGGITGELVSKNPQLGAAVASSGTKHNDLDEELNARLMDENRYYERYSYRDESGNIQTITLDDFMKHIPPDILGISTENSNKGGTLVSEELKFLEKMKGFTEKNYPELKAISPKSFESITFLRKANGAYSVLSWVEIYFEISLYNSKYKMESIQQGEYYE